MSREMLSMTLLAGLMSLPTGCDPATEAADSGTDAPEGDAGCVPGEGLEPADIIVNHEVLEFVSQTEILVWASATITPDEFEAVELPSGWFKNFPLQPNTDSVTVRQSPESADGEIVQLDRFGYTWDHAVTVEEAGVSIEDGALTRSTIIKHHDLMWEPCRTLTFLVSPDDELYVLTTQNAERSGEAPSLPPGWQTLTYQTETQLIIPLDGRITSLQATNEQLFQGPVSGVPVGR